MAWRECGESALVTVIRILSFYEKSTQLMTASANVYHLEEGRSAFHSAQNNSAAPEIVLYVLMS